MVGRNKWVQGIGATSVLTKFILKNMPFKYQNRKCVHLKVQTLNPSLNSGCNHEYKPTLSETCTSASHF